MKIIVTGAKGFIGKHVCLALKKDGHDVFEYDLDSSFEELKEAISTSDYLINLAGINRPYTVEEFYDGNTNFVVKLIELIKVINPNLIIIANSSIQADKDSDYGKSKKLAEDYLLNSGLTTYIYRFSNVFGKWCKPNYNSASATFSYNIAHNLPIEIRDRNYIVHYNYIDDICIEFLNLINKNITREKNKILFIEPVYDCSLGHLADLLYSFKDAVESDKHLPKLRNPFEAKLFIQFMDYLKDESFPYNYSKDERGSFEEIYKSHKYGQISINMSYPNVTKGGHYHTYKQEVFLVVKGKCEIRQRDINSNEMKINVVSEVSPTPINIIPNYTHDITNIGNDNSYTIMWISEPYDPNHADTFKEEVEK